MGRIWKELEEWERGKYNQNIWKIFNNFFKKRKSKYSIAIWLSNEIYYFISLVVHDILIKNHKNDH